MQNQPLVPREHADRTLSRRRILAAMTVLVLPVALVVSAKSLLNAKGPYWLGTNSDPDYAYLLNALNLLELEAPRHVDHPGTPVQISGALILWIHHSISGKNTIREDVLRDPESYLRVINNVLIALYAGILVAAGWLTLSLTNSFLSCWCVQATPFLCLSNLAELICVKPEPILLIVSACFAAATVAFLKRGGRRNDLLFAFAFGGLAGVGIATKVTAFPLAVIPLVLLTRLPARLVYCLVTVYSFCLSTIPAWDDRNLSRFFDFLWRIAMYRGRYGKEGPGPIGLSQYLDNLLQITDKEIVFTAMILSSLAVYIYSLLRADSGGLRPTDPMPRRALLATVIAELLQVLMVAKHPYEIRYLIPSLGLLGLNLFLILNVISGASAGNQRPWRSAILYLVLLAPFVYQVIQLPALYERLTGATLAQLKIVDKAAVQADDCRMIYYYRSSSVPSALWYGETHAGRRYKDELRELYPNVMIYHVWGRWFENWDGEYVDLDQVLAGNPKVLIQGTTIGDLEKFWFWDRLDVIESGRIESLYRFHRPRAAGPEES